MDLLNLLHEINSLHKKKNLIDIVNKGAKIIKEFLHLEPQIWIKDDIKNNLKLMYPQKEKEEKEIHITPENGLLVKVTIPFEREHTYYITPQHQEFKKLRENLEFSDNQKYIYLTSITSYVCESPKHIGTLVVGSETPINEKTQKIINEISNHIGTAIFKEKLYNRSDKALEDYERILALLADYIKNKLIPIAIQLQKNMQYVERLEELKKRFDEDSTSKRWDYIKEIMQMIEEGPSKKLSGILKNLGDIETFVEKITDFSDVFIPNIKEDYNPEVIELNKYFNLISNKYQIPYYSQKNTANSLFDKKYLDKLVNILIKGAKKETANIELILLDKEDQYRVIIKMHNFKVPVEKFERFFKPKTVQDYGQGKNGLYFVAAKYLADKLNIDLWINSPQNEDFTDIGFNLPKYQEEVISKNVN